jgi:hypothetical protein
MKIRASIGNPNTGEWEKSFYITLASYIEIFSQEHPGLSAYKGIEDQFSVKGYEIVIENEATVELEVHHHVPKNSVSIFVKHNGVSFVQAWGMPLRETRLV